MSCPDSNTLNAFAEGLLAPGERRVVEEHLDACDVCRLALSALAPVLASSHANPERVSLPAPGGMFDRYQVESVLGQGGMGRVYLALDTRLRRRVALKVLQNDDEADAEAVARMMREARAAASLDHPNVVSVFELGESGGHPFIVMEYVPGRSLRELSASLPEKLRVLADVAQGVAAAHKAGIVHRDIKPENVIVREDGRVKVLDFGIARRMRAEADAAATATLTGTGVIIGTPAYMAPEQLRGDKVDERTDQFAWGVLAYEWLSGKHPWTVRSGAQMVADILSNDGPIAPSQHNPALSKQADAVIARAMSKAREDRFASMDELIAAWQQVIGGSQTGMNAVVPPKRRARPRLLAILGSLVAAAVVCAFSVHAWRTRSTSSPAASAAPSASASARVMRLTERPVPRTDKPEALLLYQRGLQHIYDGSISHAGNEMAMALELDPRLAAAHVRAFVFWSGDDGGHDNYLKAHALRELLDEHDRELLHIYEPSNLRQAAPEQWVARAREAAQRHPEDQEFLWTYAFILYQLRRADEAIAVAERLIQLEPRFASAYWLKASSLAAGGDVAGARRAFRQCEEVSPDAASCIVSLGELAEHEGRCAEAEHYYRHRAQIDPENAWSFWGFAMALDGNGAPREVVLKVLQRRHQMRGFALEAWSNGPREEAMLNLVHGDFNAALACIARHDSIVASNSSEPLHQFAFFTRAAIAAELGDSKTVQRETRTFFQERASWLPGALPPFAPGDPLQNAVIAHKSGALFAAELKRLVAGSSAGAERDGGNDIDALTCVALADNRADVESCPAVPATRIMLPYSLELEEGPYSYMLGRAELVRGNTDAGLKRLHRHAHRCDRLDDPIFTVWSAQLLGEELEKKGDVAGACDAYGIVLHRWGNARPRSVTAEKARARSLALRCK